MHLAFFLYDGLMSIIFHSNFRYPDPKTVLLCMSIYLQFKPLISRSQKSSFHVFQSTGAVETFNVLLSEDIVQKLRVCHCLPDGGNIDSFT